MEVDQIYSNTKLVYSLIVLLVGLLDNCVYLFRKFLEQAFQMGAESETFWPNEEHFKRRTGFKKNPYMNLWGS